jgi:GntR family transcriptional regulator, vanillate catabolism transcriptional regulator
MAVAKSREMESADPPGSLGTSGVLPPPSRLSDDVARRLRDLILVGDLAVGAPLLQLQLSERLGVSRTPLREALRTLEREGLVRVSNGNKTVEVIPLDLAAVLEAYELREVVDGLAARLLAKAGVSEDLLDRLRRPLREMERLADDPTAIAAYSGMHAEFHTLILEHAGNRQLAMFRSIVTLTSQMQTYRSVRESRLENHRLDNHEDRQHMLLLGNEGHAAIFQAIADGAGAVAEVAARQHIRGSMAVLRSLPGFGTELAAD